MCSIRCFTTTTTTPIWIGYSTDTDISIVLYVNIVVIMTHNYYRPRDGQSSNQGGREDSTSGRQTDVKKC